MQRVQHARGSSFLPKLTFVITLGLITAATGFQARAVDVFTDPVGFITLTAVGTNGLSGNALSFIGLGMTQIPAVRGGITAIAGTSITVNNALTVGAYNTGATNPAFYVEFLDGAHPGLLDDIISNDGSHIVTASDDSAAVAGATLYKVFPHWTLNSIFGAANQAGLQGGATAGAADQIVVPNQLTQGFDTYFWFTGKGGPLWRKAGPNTEAGTTRIFNDQGFIIQKATGTNLNFLLVGAVKIGADSIPIGGTNNFVGNVYATSAMTLTNSGLVGTSSANGLVGGATVGAADTVLIHNDANQSFSTYFWFTGKGGPIWRLAGPNTDASNVQIPLGSSVAIQLLPGHNGFQWSPPPPY